MQRIGNVRGRRNAPVVKPKNFKETAARLWRYFGKERKLLGLVFALVLFGSGIGLFAPY